MRLASAAALAAQIVLTGCYAPDIRDGQYTCEAGRDNECPAGFICSTCCNCIKQGQGRDVCVPDNPCVAGGAQRVAGDPGLCRIAYCPAAFQVGPLDAAPRCGRKPPNDGQGCSLADNCGPGWHPCEDAELARLGFTADRCLTGPAGFFVTAQQGTNTLQRAVCSAMGTAAVFGCGTVDLPGQAPNCMVLRRAAQGCFAAQLPRETGFECNGQIFEQLRRRDASKPGGVMCCR